MSEFGFIAKIKDMFAAVPSGGFEGIGDDCAVCPVGGGEALVFTTDMLCEDVHFLRSAATPAETGRKSLAVNLSDIAAMGAAPAATLLSLSLPEDAAGEWAGEFMRGYLEMSQRYGVPLIGGDTTLSKSGITINVTAIGRAGEGCIKRRSAARAGDVIMVCGTLGASGAGLADILGGRYDTEYARIHKNPEPQVHEGIWLGGREEVHAMMDLSDGLASDLLHILEASSVAAVIDTENIPAAEDLRTAVCAGEDYKLLLTAEAGSAESLAADFAARFGYAPSVIGRIVDAPAHTVEWRSHGRRITPDWHGFSHF